MLPLLIGYGNPLRSDDGVAWQLAAQVGATLGERVAVITSHQLLPELAEAIRGARRVLFVDASAEGVPGTIHARDLSPAPTASRLTHHVAPEALLVLAEALYGRCPPARLLSITGASFEHGEALSDEVRAALPLLVEQAMAYLTAETGD